MTEPRGIRKQRRLEERRAGEQTSRRRRLARQLALYGVGILVAAGAAFVVLQAVSAKVYPPTGMQDHVESYPPCRICPTPIPEAVQRHIMEHRPPGRHDDLPGILVQYLCSDCPDLVAWLTRIVEQYPGSVFLAPYPPMSPRIALTTLGRIETVEDVDEPRIVAFIQKHQGR